MGRPAKPWYRESKQSWFVTLHGRKVNLGRDKDAAFRQFHRLMAGDPAPPVTLSPTVPRTTAVPVPPELLVEGLAADYLIDLERRVTTRTHTVADGYLKRFRKRFGNVRAAGLDRREVARWIESQSTWSPTTAFHVACRVTALFNWAVAESLLPSNPLKGMKKANAVCRGADAVMSAADYQRLLEAAPPYLRDILVALHDTGARPNEVLTVTAAEFYPDQGVWVVAKHKTAHRTGRPRVIHLTPRVIETCRTLAAKHPTGLLYRTLKGKPFPASYYLPRLVRELRRELGLPESVIPYGLRHGFATDALAGGVPDAVVAELLGHAGTTMLHKHYSHLGERQAALRAGLEAVRREG